MTDGALFGPDLQPDPALVPRPVVEVLTNRLGTFGASETSRLAALASYPRTGSQRARVLEVLASAGFGGLTDFEVAERAEMLRGSASKRRGELQEAGLVEATGSRRATDTGALAEVHRCTTAGFRCWDEMRTRERAS